ncbi:MULTISPECIES: hypothetical protein [unclassified Rhizobium]
MSNVISLQARKASTTSDLASPGRSHRDIEVETAIVYLRRAADYIETAADQGLTFCGAIPDVKAALFHVLTLAGCREVDRPLRDVLREV